MFGDADGDSKSLSELGRIACSAEVGKDAPCTGEPNFDGIGEGEAADDVEEPAECHCE
jgi:hypothetical protein